MTDFPLLYKRTSTGATQTWFLEQDGEKYRTHSGQLNSPNIVVSEWKACVGKNLGKKNETSPEMQAILEIESQYKKKLSQGNYKESIDDIDEDNFFKPMLAKDYNDHPLSSRDFENGVAVQPKLDGMRCIATRDGLFSRQGKQIMSAPHILETLKNIWDSNNLSFGIVFDGELYNHQLKDDFNEVMSLARQSKPTQEDLEKSRLMLQYHVYDCYSPELSHLNFVGRTKLLKKYLHNPMFQGAIQLVETHVVDSCDTLDSLYTQFIEEGYEGQIVRLNTPYENKRTKNLLKRKEFQDAEFQIVAIEEGLGNRSDMAGSITYRLSDGRTFNSGIKGGVEFYRSLYADRESYVGGQGTVKYFQLTPDGIPRFPVTVAVYKTKRDT